MVNIEILRDYTCTDTIVPNEFIDFFMPEANGEFVKVYLYLLRSMQSHASNCTISAIADCFNNTEMDVIRALRYWQKTGLLHLEEENGEICKIHLLPISNSNADTSANVLEAPVAPPIAENITQNVRALHNSTPEMPVSTPSAQPVDVQKHSYTADEIAGFLKNDDISELFFIVETYIKHPLSENDMNTVLFWHEDLHFSNDLIVYLLEYCISKGHSSMRYLDKVAMGWHDNNITTVTQAKEDAAIHSQAYYGVMKALGITGRSLVEAETTFIRKWTKEFAFDLPLIQEACARTIAATHQPSFEYTDSILTSWHKNHVHTLEDIKNLDAAYAKAKKTAPQASASDSAPASAPRKNSFNNFKPRSYDYEDLEGTLLSSTSH